MAAESAAVAESAVVADPAVAAESAVVADPAVAAESVVVESAVAEPVAGVVESMRGQAERLGLSPVQRLLCWQRAVSRLPLP